MTWEEELRRLDAELAAGRISAEEHRTRREAARGHRKPAAGPVHQQPFPPAFSWADSRPQLRPVTADPQQPTDPCAAATGPAAAQADAPQVVPDQFTADDVEQARADADRARIVSFAGPPEPGPERVRARPLRASGGGHPVTGPPHPTASHRPRQGPEVFDTAGRPSKTRRRTAVLWMLVVLGIAVIGAIAALVPREAPRSQPPSARVSLPESAGPSEPPGPKPAPASTQDVLALVPPGRVNPLSGLFTPADLQGPKSAVLPAPARDAALRSGVVDGWFSGTGSDPRTSLIAVRMPDQRGASDVVRAYLDAQQGLSPVASYSYAGVPAVSDGAGTFHTAYVSHEWAVVVEVAGQQPGAGELFQDVLGQQVALSPPTVR